MLKLPSFYREFASRPAVAGSVVAAFLASFIPNGSKYGHPGVDAATDALARTVLDHAPVESTIGYLSRLAYGVFVPGATLVEGRQLADVIRRSVDGLNVEVGSGEVARISAAVGVVGFAVSSDHWRILEELAAEVARDLSVRFPSDWQYPILIYPA